MPTQAFRYLIIALLLSTTMACSTTKPAELPTKKFSVSRLENQVTEQIVEVVFKDGKTQRAVISLINQKYWRLVSEEVFAMEDINKLKVKDKEGNLITVITSDSLANVVLIFKITGKGIEKIVDLF